MPLSTSSSETSAAGATHPGKRAIWTLLAVALLICTCLEGAAIFGLERVSKIHRRIMGEAQGAVAVRHGAPGRPKTLVALGNSLLLTGLNPARMESDLSGRYVPKRYVVESTAYLDWFYGLRRLFGEGMRPDVVMVGLDPSQLIPNVVRGDFSAHFLFDAADIWPMSRAVRADLTTTSSFYAAHYSTFFAARAELRTVLMGKLFPAVPALWGISVPVRPVRSSFQEVIPLMAGRLADLDRLCRQYQSQFIYIIPPTRLPGDTEAVEASRRAGVRVIHPIPNSSLPMEDYEQDGFHLNERGALLFTDAVAVELIK